MKKKKVLFISCSITCLALFLSFFAISNKESQNKFLSYNGDSYNLNFNKIYESDSPCGEEISASISTSFGSNISIKASNVANYEDGWQTILPNGYFYNPLTNSDSHNKISGISSIRFNSNDDKDLCLYYGYSINNNQIIYSHKKTLKPNVTYSLNNVNPTYFYIKNTNDVNVDISSFNIVYSCSDLGYSNQNLNVLMIGNSFADDTLFYASRVANSYGINLNLYDAYIAGCTIDQHYTNFNNNNAPYSMRSMNNGSWVYNNNMSLKEIIGSNTWDIITFQQASAEVGRSESYSNLSNLVNAVRGFVGPSPRFYWHQTWAYDKDYHDYYDYFSYFDNNQELMFNAIIDCYQIKVAPLGLFDLMIPAGTAVQNLRTSYMKETFTRDGKHMSSVHGRYLLGLDFVSNIYDIDLDMSPCSYLPPEINSTFKNVAYEAIRNAYDKPLEVTNSLYTTFDLGEYDLSNYTEIDAGLVGCSYWNCTDNSNYNKRMSNVSGTSNLYTSTKRFTSNELPVGSLVVCDEAFGYRPEAWVDDSVQGNRKAESYQNVLEVGTDFFDGYTYRAFNIFKASKTDLMGQYSQIFDGFHIYVPNNVLGDIKPKNYNSSYNNDKNIFASSYLNIDAYERIHLDPITGFYKCDQYYELKNSYVDDTAKKFLCTRPFYSANNDLPENTVIIVDNGYQWRSDCWGSHATYSPRPNNVTSTLTRLDSFFWSGFRRRTFNISSTSGTYVNQNYLSFMNHLRIYVPINDDIDIEPESTVTMTASGYVTMTAPIASYFYSNNPQMIITLHGDSLNKVNIKIGDMIINADSYTYDKNNGLVSITTSSNAKINDYTFGTITGVVDSNVGTISNITFNGTISPFIANNGSILCSEIWHDCCNYATNAASQITWQRWYMTGSWQANNGSGDWTTSSSTYRLDNEKTMGLRIANNSYGKTRFTLREDFNNGEGFHPNGISLWILNPNGNIYSSFRIYSYLTPSSTSGDHAHPSSTYDETYRTTNLGSGEWININVSLSQYATIYNISFYFETSSSATTYVYLGHVSFY